MYIVWYFDYLFSDVTEVANFFFDIARTIDNCIDSVTALVNAFPLWLSVPFGALLSIAVLFRLSQFIPSLGGAS